MTLIEVLDTAVKVGLGALISGVSTYLMGKSKARDDLKQARIQRHLDLLETTAEQIEEFSHMLLRYWALMSEYTKLNAAGQEMLPHRSEELTRVKAGLFDAFSSLTSAEAKLLLLGQTDAQLLLRDLGEVSKQIRQEAHEKNPKLTEQRMNEMRELFIQTRQELFSKLSTCFLQEA